ncbi:MAG: alpha/beta hydrolase [Planctomycetota bacterium]|nr:alpha/beta hydrolase [Planctomycetota bacterium]
MIARDSLGGSGRHPMVAMAAVLAFSTALGCSQDAGGKSPPVPAGVRTEDVDIRGEASGFLLRGTVWFPAGVAEGRKAPAVILLHMMNHDRSTWRDLAGRLAERGVWVLACDAPGHGESTRGLDGRRKGKWKDFASNQAFWKNFYADMPAVKAALAAKGADVGNLAVCGASIGANWAMVMCADDPDIKAAVALSPGRNYRGIETYGPAARIRKPLLVACSKGDDDPDAGPRIAELAGCAKSEGDLRGEKVFRQYPGSRHGTDLFEEDPRLPELLAEWITARLKGANPGAEAK